MSSTNVKQRSEKYPEETFLESDVTFSFVIFCVAVMIPLISNKKQAVTNIVRDIRVRGRCKQFNLQ